MILKPSQFMRLLHINRVLIRHGLDDVILATHLLRPIGFIRHWLPWNRLRQPAASTGERIRRSLEDLGPIFVKFGQMLSTRRDLLPDDIADELARLQDQVPPFPDAQAKSIIEKALGQPVGELFKEFSEQPLASASIAQVHAATLDDGRKVVVKVVRPDIEKTIQHDIELMYVIAKLAERYWKEGRRLRPVEVVAEYEKTIFDELDLIREGANATQLRRNFEGSSMLYIPEVHWPLTRRNVLVLERINGLPIGEIAELKRLNVDMKKLSSAGVEIFFTQVFRDSFFHADMHPGNIFVDTSNPAQPKYIAVDFGIIGTLSPQDQHYLAENFLAFFDRDYRRVAELHVESGWVPADTRVDEFESAIRTVSEPIFDRPLKDISFGHFLLSLFQTARRFDMQVQPQLVLLQKTLLNIEGLGRQLDPDLDLWQTAKPSLERWMKERVGPKGLLREIKKNAPRWIEHLPELPDLVFKSLKQQSGEQSANSKEIEKLREDMRRANRRQFQGMVGAAMIISAALIFGLDGHQPLMVGGAPFMTWILGIVGILLLVNNWPSD